MGIDLGTSFTAAATASAWALDMVPLAGQSIITPSVAYLDEQGTLLTGEAADRLGLQNPGRAAREFKRRLGDPTPVILDGAPYSPTALMAALLRTVVDTVTQAQGAPPDRIVLTHPAVWGPYRREQFAAIPHLAGLPRPQTEPEPDTDGPTVITVTEPVAAATYYCSTQPLPPDGLLAVYDLGGGTFDSAVVRNGRDGLEIIGTPEGIEWLGGADFDQALMDHVDRQLGGAITALDPTDPGTAAILATLQRDCMHAKETLSTREKTDITVPLPGSPRHVTVTRETFEQMITPPVETTMETFRRTLTAAGVTLQDLTAVLLVGGSSQIPLVTQLLRDTLRRPIMTNTHPKHAVALGAAILSSDTHTARSTPPPRRPTANPRNPTGAARTTAGHDSDDPPADTGRTAAPGSAEPADADADTGAMAGPGAGAGAGAPAPQAKRGAKHRARSSVQPVSGPAGDTHPASVPPPTRRRWSRLAIARVVVAPAVVLALLGVALASGAGDPSDRPQVSGATSGTVVPSDQAQAPGATPDATPSGQTPTPSPTPQPSTPSKRPQKPSAAPRTSAPGGRPTLKLDDVQVQRPSKLSTVRTAAVGTKHLIDRPPVFTSLPAPLAGAVLIPGASDDKRLTSPADYLVFDVAHDATVYVAFDRRGAPEVDDWWPAWVNQKGFKRTSMIIPTNDKDQRHFVVFAKEVPAGRVTLGPNAADSVYSTGYITLLVADE